MTAICWRAWPARRVYCGAGTVQPPEKSRRALEKYKAAVSISNPMDSQYLEGTRLLYENEADWDRVGRH